MQNGMENGNDLLSAEMRPTPKPAKNRPARKRGMAVAMVWRTTPRLNTHVEMRRAGRRPRWSARKGEARAPKNVPAERMETMPDSSAVEISGRPLESV